MKADYVYFNFDIDLYGNEVNFDVNSLVECIND